MSKSSTITNQDKKKAKKIAALKFSVNLRCKHVEDHGICSWRNNIVVVDGPSSHSACPSHAMQSDALASNCGIEKSPLIGIWWAFFISVSLYYFFTRNTGRWSFSCFWFVWTLWNSHPSVAHPLIIIVIKTAKFINVSKDCIKTKEVKYLANRVRTANTTAKVDSQNVTLSCWSLLSSEESITCKM